jgi:hypothetical protein
VCISASVLPHRRMPHLGRIIRTVAGSMLRSTMRPGAVAAANRRVCSTWQQPAMPSVAPFRRSALQTRLSHPMHRLSMLAAAANAAAAAAAAPSAADAADAAGLSTVVDAQMTWPARTAGAGALRESDAGREVTVCGWVDRNRNMGGLCFLDVRDHTGLLQVRFFMCMRGHMRMQHMRMQAHAS